MGGGFRDLEYFRQAARHPVLLAVAERHGFDPPEVDQKQANAVLVYHRLNRLIPEPSHSDRGVWPQFAAWRPGEVRLEAQLHPYVPSLHQKPAQQKELELSLAVREEFLLKLRKRVLADRDLVQLLGANTRSLGTQPRVNSCCVVKFLREAAGQPSTEAFAAFYAEVIETVIPVVQEVLAEWTPTTQT